MIANMTMDTERECVVSLMGLPDDCLVLIFQSLNSSNERDSLGLTCKRWHKIQNHCRKSLQFQCSFSVLDRSSLVDNMGSVKPYQVHQLLCRFNHLRRLSLSGCTELTDSSLRQLRYCGSKLNILNMDCCFRITDAGLSTVAEGCPSLLVLSLYRCFITDIGLEFLGRDCIYLTRINLSYCLKISDSGVSSLIESCTRLKAIKLSSCSGVRGAGLKSSSPTLSFVDVESCKLDLEGIRGIISGVGLKFLSLSGVTSPIPSNEFLSIGADFVSRLKILNLRMCQSVGDDSVIAIAKGCHLLEELNLALCHGVRILGWKAIGIFCNNLERLHVNRCKNLCDGGLEALKEGCKRLAVLYISASISSPTPLAIELFKLRRSNVLVKNEEIVYIGSPWFSGQ